MKNLENLKEMFCAELDEISRKGELNAGDLETAHKLTDTIKNIDKIEMLEEDEYSESDGMYTGRRYSRNSYGRGGEWMANGSYSRGRRRDSMGRYSRAAGDVMTQLEEMLADAKDERERAAIQSALTMMR